MFECLLVASRSQPLSYIATSLWYILDDEATCVTRILITPEIRLENFSSFNFLKFVLALSQVHVNTLDLLTQ